MILRCLYPANDTIPVSPCHGKRLEDRVFAGGAGAIVLACPVCEVMYFELDEEGNLWEVVEDEGMLIRISPVYTCS